MIRGKDQRGKNRCEEHQVIIRIHDFFSESSVDISDIMSVVDPLSKIEAGLKGTGDKVIPLQSVHIRARLLDLAAQVI